MLSLDVSLPRAQTAKMLGLYFNSPIKTQETKTYEKLNNLWILKFKG